MSREGFYLFAYYVTRPFVAMLYPHEYIGRENIPEGAAVFCPDHSNALDPILVSLAIGKEHYVRHLAKSDLKVPFLGWYMKNSGSIFVKRGESDIEAYKECVNALRAGDKLLVFPEGTRVHGNNVVKPKSGAVRMAIRANVPIVPVYVPRDKKLFRRTRVVFGEPYYAQRTGDKTYDDLADELMEKIWALRDETEKR